MAKQSVTTLKSYFEARDKPTQAQFGDLIDSYVHKDEARVTISTSDSTASVVVGADRLLAKINIKSNSAQTVSVGTSAGGTQIVNAIAIGANERTVLSVDWDSDSGGTLYFSGLAGSNVIKLYFQ